METGTLQMVDVCPFDLLSAFAKLNVDDKILILVRPPNATEYGLKRLFPDDVYCEPDEKPMIGKMLFVVSLNVKTPPEYPNVNLFVIELKATAHATPRRFSKAVMKVFAL